MTCSFPCLSLILLFPPLLAEVVVNSMKYCLSHNEFWILSSKIRQVPQDAFRVKNDKKCKGEYLYDPLCFSARSM